MRRVDIRHQGLELAHIHALADALAEAMLAPTRVLPSPPRHFALLEMRPAAVEVIVDFEERVRSGGDLSRLAEQVLTMRVLPALARVFERTGVQLVATVSTLDGAAAASHRVVLQPAVTITTFG